MNKSISIDSCRKTRSREDGERDLWNLVDKENQDGSWIFREEDNKWFNIRKKSLTPTCIGLDSGIGDIDKFPKISNWKRVSHYHLHLKSVEESAYAQRDIPSYYFPNWESIECAIPGKEDLRAYLKIERKFRNTLKQKKRLEIDYRVVSQHGMVIIRNLQSGSDEDDLIKSYRDIAYRNIGYNAFTENKSKAIDRTIKNIAIATSLNGICSVEFVERNK